MLLVVSVWDHTWNEWLQGLNNISGLLLEVSWESHRIFNVCLFYWKLPRDLVKIIWLHGKKHVLQLSCKAGRQGGPFSHFIHLIGVHFIKWDWTWHLLELLRTWERSEVGDLRIRDWAENVCTSWGERGLAITSSLCPLPFPKFSLLSEQRGDRLLHGRP